MINFGIDPVRQLSALRTQRLVDRLDHRIHSGWIQLVQNLIAIQNSQVLGRRSRKFSQHAKVPVEDTILITDREVAPRK